MNKSSLLFALTLLTVAILVMAVGATAQTESVVFSIAGGASGSSPRGGLVFDNAGNLYGTSQYGAIYGRCCGAVWEISPIAGGGWSGTVLHTFSGGVDGATPSAGLVVDTSGNVYGTASYGGNLNTCSQGCGVVFELSPRIGGGWKGSILHQFSGGADGANPWSSLTFDAAGNLYGTTFAGGVSGSGLVFKLAPNSRGGWTETVLHAFTGGNEGANPLGSLVFDSAGNLYGTTSGGGNTVCNYFEQGCGVVFQLSPQSNGHWKESVIHAFNGKYGDAPQGGVVFDAAGNLYGATAVGGESNGCDGGGCGVVFQLSPTSSGPWKFTELREFKDTEYNDGFYPLGNLLLDGSGNVYGTTSEGGDCGFGVVFQLSPKSGGGEKYSVIHSFACSGDGAAPLAGMIFDASGDLYGTTSQGGADQVGTVFEITP
jgi:uncharacterized repeat protein (TIGR03803 family)